MRDWKVNGSGRLYISAGLIFLVLLVSSCAVITVNSGLNGPSALAVGQTGSYSVGASDTATKALIYTWFVDDIQIASTSNNSGSSSFNYAALQADIDATHKIRVDIDDGKGQNKSFSMKFHVSGANPGGNPQVEIMGPAKASALTYARLTIPTGYTSVFIAATNLGTGTTSFPTIKSFQSRNLSDTDSSWSPSPPSRSSGNAAQSTPFNGPVPKAPPAIVTRYQNGPQRGPSGIVSRSLAPGTAPRVWTGPPSGPVPPGINNSMALGTTATFNTVEDDGLTWDPISATLLGRVTMSNGVAVDIWADSSITYGNISLDASAILAKFANATPGNYIYDLDTNIFGTEWYHNSETPENGLIGPTNRISILLYDINKDANSDGSLNQQSYTVGYFHSLHNYVYKANDPDQQFSNQEIMFVIDYPFYLAISGSDTDWGKKVVYSTLAHEFQHMIHFYQRGVLKNLSSETWINEMMSMTTEDEVDPELTVNANPVPGPAETRLGEYNTFPDQPLEYWDGTTTSYALHYSFGAYLIRNFGGVNFLKALMQSNQQSGEGMVNDALQANSSSLKFGDVERRWPAAVLLSDSTTQPAGFQFSRPLAGTFDSTATVIYSLPSLNFFASAYQRSDGLGPYISSSSSTFNPNGFWGSSFVAGSTIYHQPVSSVSAGTYAFITNLPAHVGLTAVYK